MAGITTAKQFITLFKGHENGTESMRIRDLFSRIKHKPEGQVQRWVQNLETELCIIDEMAKRYVEYLGKELDETMAIYNQLLSESSMTSNADAQVYEQTELEPPNFWAVLDKKGYANGASHCW